MSAAYSVTMPRRMSAARASEPGRPAAREERSGPSARPLLERSTRVSSIAEALTRWLDAEL
jgi:hypothetical protein